MPPRKRRPKYQTPAPGAYYPENSVDSRHARPGHITFGGNMAKVDRAKTGIQAVAHQKSYIPGPGAYQGSGDAALRLRPFAGNATRFNSVDRDKLDKLFMEHKKDHGAGRDAPGPGTYNSVETHKISKGRKKSTASPQFSFSGTHGPRMELVPGMKETPGPGSYQPSERPDTGTSFGAGNRFSPVQAVPNGVREPKFVYAPREDEEREVGRGGKKKKRGGQRRELALPPSSLERQTLSTRRNPRQVSIGHRVDELVQMHKSGILLRQSRSSQQNSPGPGQYRQPSAMFNTMDSTKKNTAKVRMVEGPRWAPDSRLGRESPGPVYDPDKHTSTSGGRFPTSRTHRYIEGVMASAARESIPGPGAYVSQNDRTGTSGSSIRISAANRDQAEKLYISKLDTGTDANAIYAGRDSPGPGAYTIRAQTAPGGTFGTSGKSEARKKFDDSNLGPGRYEIPSSMASQVLSSRKSSPQPHFPSSTREKDSMVVQPNFNPTFRGQIENPGPGSYRIPTTLSSQPLSRVKNPREISFGKGDRLPKEGPPRSPGPGAYTQASTLVGNSVMGQKGHKFSTSEREPLDAGLVG